MTGPLRLSFAALPSFLPLLVDPTGHICTKQTVEGGSAYSRGDIRSDMHTNAQQTIWGHTSMYGRRKPPRHKHDSHREASAAEERTTEKTREFPEARTGAESEEVRKEEGGTRSSGRRRMMEKTYYIHVSLTPLPLL